MSGLLENTWVQVAVNLIKYTCHTEVDYLFLLGMIFKSFMKQINNVG